MLDRLRTARGEAELTQHDASVKLGRYPTYVNKVETGERRLDPIELIDLAKLYGKDIQFFLDDE